MLATLERIELPIKLVPARRWDDDELLRFCAEHRELRIERNACGEIEMMSPAHSGTGRSNASLTGQLWVWAEADGRGVSFDSSSGFTLPDGSMRNPDAAWIRRDRWEALGTEEHRRFAHICPEFVVELRSHSDALPVLQAKMQMWIRNGAELAWLIDPESRSVEVYRREREPELLISPPVLEGEGPVNGFLLSMPAIWS